MKTKNAIEINKSGGLELTEIIENWEGYDTNTVILAYCELEKRNFSISEDLQQKVIPSFCEKNNVENITHLINSFLKEKNCQSYEEFLKKEEQLNYKNKVIDPSHIISAGKAIKDVVFTAFIMISFGIILSLLGSVSGEEIAFILGGLSTLVCNIIILYKLHTAGNKLEKSVTNRL